MFRTGACALAVSAALGTAAASQTQWSSGLQPMGWEDGGAGDHLVWYRRPAIQPMSNPYRRIWARAENETARDFGVLTQSGKPLPVLGTVTLIEVDCSEAKFRTLEVIYYAERNLGGDSVTLTSKAPDWGYAAPGTVGEDETRAACEVTEASKPAAPSRRRTRGKR
jgi:hypothetical protein